MELEIFFLTDIFQLNTLFPPNPFANSLLTLEVVASEKVGQIAQKLAEFRYSRSLLSRVANRVTHLCPSYL